MELSSPKTEKFQEGTFQAQKIKKITLKKLLIHLFEKSYSYSFGNKLSSPPNYNTLMKL